MSSRRSLWLGAGLVMTLAATWYAAGVDDTADNLLATPQRAAPPVRSTAVAAAKPQQIGRAHV